MFFRPLVLLDPYEGSKQNQQKQDQSIPSIYDVRNMYNQSGYIPNAIIGPNGQIFEVYDLYNLLNQFMPRFKGATNISQLDKLSQIFIENDLIFFDHTKMRSAIYLFALVENFPDAEKILTDETNSTFYKAIIFLKDKNVEDLKHKIFHANNPAHIDSNTKVSLTKVYADPIYNYSNVPGVRRKKLDHFIFNPYFLGNSSDDNFLVKSFEEVLNYSFGQKQNISVKADYIKDYLEKKKGIKLEDFNGGKIDIGQTNLNQLKLHLKEILIDLGIDNNDLAEFNFNDEDIRHIVLNYLLVGVNRDFGQLIFAVFADLLNKPVDDSEADTDFRNIFGFERSIARKYFNEVSLFEMDSSGNPSFAPEKIKKLTKFFESLEKLEYIPEDLKDILNDYKNADDKNKFFDGLRRDINKLKSIQLFMLYSSFNFSIVQFASGETAAATDKEIKLIRLLDRAINNNSVIDKVFQKLGGDQSIYDTAINFIREKRNMFYLPLSIVNVSYLCPDVDQSGNKLNPKEYYTVGDLFDDVRRIKPGIQQSSYEKLATEHMGLVKTNNGYKVVNAEKFRNFPKDVINRVENNNWDHLDKTMQELYNATYQALITDKRVSLVGTSNSSFISSKVDFDKDKRTFQVSIEAVQFHYDPSSGNVDMNKVESKNCSVNSEKIVVVQNGNQIPLNRDNNYKVDVFKDNNKVVYTYNITNPTNLSSEVMPEGESLSLDKVRFDSNTSSIYNDFVYGLPIVAAFDLSIDASFNPSNNKITSSELNNEQIVPLSGEGIIPNAGKTTVNTPVVVNPPQFTQRAINNSIVVYGGDNNKHTIPITFKASNVYLNEGEEQINGEIFVCSNVYYENNQFKIKILKQDSKWEEYTLEPTSEISNGIKPGEIGEAVFRVNIKDKSNKPLGYGGLSKLPGDKFSCFYPDLDTIDESLLINKELKGNEENESDMFTTNILFEGDPPNAAFAFGRPSNLPLSGLNVEIQDNYMYVSKPTTEELKNKYGYQLQDGEKLDDIYVIESNITHNWLYIVSITFDNGKIKNIDFRKTNGKEIIEHFKKKH